MAEQSFIERARNQGKWLHCHYQDLWFSPDELEAQNRKGKFLWGEVNWSLRNPQEHIRELQNRIVEIEKEISVFDRRIAASKK